MYIGLFSCKKKAPSEDDTFFKDAAQVLLSQRETLSLPSALRKL